jgi:beta-glucanase (GH16 family)
VEWAPDYIAWYFDGEEIRRSTGAQVIDCQKNDMSYRFNAWVSDVPSWAGAFNPSVLPVYMYINWVNYSKYTPGAGDDGTDFTFEWRDDFDTFDTTRWAKGDWTFDGNLVDFSPDNIIVKDGYCIIGITNAGQTEYSGTVPEDKSTSVNNPRNGSVITTTPLHYTHLQKSFIVSLNGRLLPAKSWYTLDKLCPGVWITENKMTIQKRLLYVR